MEAEEQPVAEERKGSGRGRKKKPAGDAKMRAEASRALSEKSTGIADKLAEMAEGGDLKSLELLYKLSKEPDAQGASQSGPALKRSYAVRFATEPEWNGAAAEKAAQEMGTAAEHTR
ncbi:MAG TPA: hypothetical protein VN151_06125 [Terracidiphilus sp.]|nr:hypothetical protein [Terracidiphilus sp.]